MLVSPSDAAMLAHRIYDVQNPVFVDTFLKLPPFRKSGSRPNSVHLKAEVGGRVVLNYRDGFGVCSEGEGRYKGDVFLVFRGTTKKNKGADFLTDSRIGVTLNGAGLPVHCGFDHCFTSMLPEIKKYFASLGGGVKAVHCIGHSLGGAVAALAADWIARNLKHPTRLYTFGAPRVGTGRFAKSTTASLGSAHIYRVYHKTDPVPMVPLYPFMQAPYDAVGHYVHSSEPLLSGVAHKVARYRKSVEGKAWPALADAPEQPYTLERAVENWLASKTPVDSSSPVFWRWLDSALIYVLKKVSVAALASIQGAAIGIMTVADKMAYWLAKGVSLAGDISIWVERLLRKMMQALGMRAPRSKKALTEQLIRRVLRRLTAQSNRDARNAIDKS